MGTRTSFRPRPLDTLRQLNIVRDVKELDDGEQKVSRDIVHSHEALDKDNEEVYDTALKSTMTCFSGAIQAVFSIVLYVHLPDMIMASDLVCLRCLRHIAENVHMPSDLSLRSHMLCPRFLSRETIRDAHFPALLAVYHHCRLSSCLSLIIDLTGMSRRGWCRASRPKVERKFQHQMLELCLHTAWSICPYTRSLGSTSGAKVIVLVCPNKNACARHPVQTKMNGIATAKAVSRSVCNGVIHAFVTQLALGGKRKMKWTMILMMKIGNG